MFYITNNPNYIDRFVGQGDLIPPSQKYGRETPLGTSTGSNSDIKINNDIDTTNQNDTTNDIDTTNKNDTTFLFNEWYEFHELAKLTSATTKNGIKQYCDTNNWKLVEGRPRINGVQVRRLKIVET